MTAAWNTTTISLILSWNDRGCSDEHDIGNEHFKKQGQNTLLYWPMFYNQE